MIGIINFAMSYPARPKKRKGAEFLRAPVADHSLLNLTPPFSVNDAVLCVTVPSVAVTVMGYAPGTVAGRSDFLWLSRSSSIGWPRSPLWSSRWKLPRSWGRIDAVCSRSFPHWVLTDHVNVRPRVRDRRCELCCLRWPPGIIWNTLVGAPELLTHRGIVTKLILRYRRSVSPLP